MTVTNTSYTTNSFKVTVTSELGSTNIISGVDTAITSLGWTQYDVIATTTYSPITTYVYRVLNYDATTYKYFIIRWDTIKLCMYTSTCESWNNSTHVATNESWTNCGAFPQFYDIKNSIILISATSRHIVIWPFILGEPGMWAGVFEFERVAVEDTVSLAVPCFAWTNSLMLGTAWGKAADNTQSQYMLAFPRTADGATGAIAVAKYGTVTNKGMFPPAFATGTVSITDTNSGHLGSYYNMTYGWDPTKIPASPISAEAIGKSMPLGRMYDVGITKPIGNPLDTTYMTIDSTGGWPSSSGANTECILLPLNGGSELSSNSNGGVMTTNYATLGGPVTKIIPIGSLMWIATTAGVYTWDMGSAAGSSGTSIISGVITDIIFDGQRSVYAATATGITKIDTETLATVSLAISGGLTYLAQDQNYIYATNRAYGNYYATLYISPKSSWATTPTYTTCNTPTLSGSYVNGTKPAPDYNGTLYLGICISTGTQYYAYVYSITSSSNTLTHTTPTEGYSGYLGDAATPYVDPTSSRIFAIYTPIGNCCEFSNTLTQISTTGGVNNFSSGSYALDLGSFSSVTGYLGYQLVPVRGLILAQADRSGQVFGSNNSYRVISWNYPGTGSPTQLFGNYNVTTDSWPTSGYIKSYKNGMMSTNGSRLFFGSTGNVAYYIKNIYSQYNTTGGTTGRLTLKG